MKFKQFNHNFKYNAQHFIKTLGRYNKKSERGSVGSF